MAKHVLLTIIDHMILLAVVAPLVVAFWWGTWTLLDLYIYPSDVMVRSGITAAIGYAGMTSAYCLRDCLLWLDKRCNEFGRFFLNHFFIITVGFFNVCHWHGVWNLCMCGIEEVVALLERRALWYGLTLAVGVAIMMLVRNLNSMLAPPVIIVLDIDCIPYTPETRFNTKWAKDGAVFILDCIFTECVSHTLVVVFWMSSWTIWDTVMAKYVLLTDGLICLAVGAALALLVFLLQIFTFLAGECSVAVWRGFWLIYAEKVQVSGNPVAGSWIGCIGGLVLLMCMLNGSSVICMGAPPDGAKPGGQGAVLDTRYIRYFVSKWKNKDNDINTYPVEMEGPRNLCKDYSEVPVDSKII